MSGLGRFCILFVWRVCNFENIKYFKMKIHKKMKRFIGLVCLIMLWTLKLTAQQNTAKPIENSGFAVLELFTSEGCSSCPPAEALLEKIDASTSRPSVYVLCFHVDYWDRLGWKDPFSDHRYALRQYKYSRLFSGQVYTPQLVINGNTEGVGSNVAFVKKGIAQALLSKPVASLEVNISQEHWPGILRYGISGISDLTSLKLVVAIVKKHATSRVLRGENKDRTLSHAAIVRDLQTFSIGKEATGDISIKLPEKFNPADWDIVSFLQNPVTGIITAATRATYY